MKQNVGLSPPPPRSRKLFEADQSIMKSRVVGLTFRVRKINRYRMTLVCRLFYPVPMYCLRHTNGVALRRKLVYNYEHQRRLSESVVRFMASIYLFWRVTEFPIAIIKSERSDFNGRG